MIYSPTTNLVTIDPDNGESALHVAVSVNHEDIVLRLLELGASVSTQDSEGLTPIMVACQYGHLQSLEKLGTRGIAKPSECMYMSAGTRWTLLGSRESVLISEVS